MTQCPKCQAELDAKGRCSVCRYRSGKEKGQRNRLLYVGLVVVYSLIALVLWQLFGSGQTNPLQRLFGRSAVYEVSVPPPEAPAPRGPLLSQEQALSLSRLFETSDFATLTRELETLQESFEADQNNEHLIVDAFARFAVARADYTPLLDAWVAAFPEHFAPYLARAQYRVEMGWQSRGNDYAPKTPQGNFRSMRQHFELALSDLKQALTFNPKLLPAYRLLINIYNTQGDDYLLNEAFATGRRLFPTCYRLYRMMLWATEPRWGGSFEEMETLAVQAYQQGGGNPGLATLFGLIYLEQGRQAWAKKRYAKALDLCDRALAYGQSPEFYRQRGRILEEMGKLQEAFADFDAAIALAPSLAIDYEHRYYVRSLLGDHAGAVSDAFKSWELSGQSPEYEKIYLWARMRQLELDDAKRPKKVVKAEPTATSFVVRSASTVHIEKRFQAPAGTKPSGLTWAAGRLYLSSYGENPGVYMIDPANGRVLARHTPEIVKSGWYGGLATDGSDIFHVQAREGRHAARLDGRGLSVKKHFFFNCPEKTLTDMAILNGSLYAIGTDDFMDVDGFRLMRFSPEGDLQQAFQYHHEVDKHAFGCGLTSDGRWLYVASWDKLIKVDPASGNIVEKYPLRLYNIMGLAWDGEALWAASYLGPVYRITLD